MARFVESETTSRSIWAPVAVIIVIILLALAAWFVFTRKATPTSNPNGSSVTPSTESSTPANLSPSITNPGGSSPRY